MKITYISHSGFAVKCESCQYIFDYYRGELPQLDKDKQTIVFCSHFHHDHFNPQVFTLLDDMGLKYRAVLSDDISRKKYPKNAPVTTACPGEEYKIGDTQIKTLRSTDSGVAFLVSTDEGIIYHAGDLNDWYWEGEPDSDNIQMTARYRKEIDKLKNIQLKAAFVPLDPRQGEHSADGLLYFLKNVNCDAVYPMHYWGEQDIIDKFTKQYPEYSLRIKSTESAKEEII